MPSHKRNWVFTLGQDYVRNGSLSLGQILEDPWEPASALMPTGTIPIPSNIIREQSEKNDVSVSHSDTLNASFELWATARLPAVSAGGTAGANTERSHTAAWQIKTLSAEIFLPSVAYIKDALGHGDVPTKTQWWKLRRRIYMITGVRIAHRASMDVRATESSNVHGRLHGDATGANVPVEVGVGAKHAAQQSDSIVAKGMSDFVFAYRLSEVTYRIRVSSKPYAEGETSALPGNEDVKPDQEDGGSESYVVEGPGEEFDGGWEVPMDTFSLSAGGGKEEVFHTRK
jgi:hypothetical protein